MAADPAEARRQLSEALSRWNGLSDADREARAIIERVDAEVEQEKTAALEAQLAALNEKVGQLVTNTAPPAERRSTMTAKRKSELIRSIGVAKYREIPW